MRIENPLFRRSYVLTPHPHLAGALRTAARKVVRCAVVPTVALRLISLMPPDVIQNAGLAHEATASAATATVAAALLAALLAALHSPQRLCSRPCSQMPLPPQSLHTRRSRLCSQMLLPPQSLHR